MFLKQSLQSCKPFVPHVHMEHDNNRYHPESLGQSILKSNSCSEAQTAVSIEQGWGCHHQMMMRMIYLFCWWRCWGLKLGSHTIIIHFFKKILLILFEREHTHVWVGGRGNGRGEERRESKAGSLLSRTWSTTSRSWPEQKLRVGCSTTWVTQVPLLLFIFNKAGKSI